MDRHVHHQLMRNELHNFITIVPVTIYHYGSYVETYSRFTPQDGNALLSSIAATAWLMYPETCAQRIHQFVETCLFDEV